MGSLRSGRSAVATIVLAAVSAATPAAAEELFSRSSIGSIFSAPVRPVPSPEPLPSPTPSPSPGPTPTRITAESLPEFLLTAGFTPEKLGNGVCGMQLPKGKWTFPVVAILDDKTNQIGFGAILSTAAKPEAIPASRLLGMLRANDELAPRSFGISSDGGRISLLSVLPNRDLTPPLLRKEIEELLNLALKHESLWDQSQWGTTSRPVEPPPNEPIAIAPLPPSLPQPPVAPPPPPVTPPQAPQPPVEPPPYWVAPTTPTPKAAPTPVPVPSRPASPTPPAPPIPTTPRVETNSPLVGKWLCTVSTNEAFGLVFEAAGTYRLIHVLDGKNNVIDGRFTLGGSQLRFVSDANETLEGTIAWISPNEFRFRTSADVGPNSGLLFARLAE